jgi:hypothetical protein
VIEIIVIIRVGERVISSIVIGDIKEEINVLMKRRD